MKLSMWILFEELEMFGARCDIKNGKRVIESFRVLPSPEPRLESCVYVEQSDGRVLLKNSEDVISFDAGSASEVVNRVIRVFDKYRDWDARLKSACLDTSPFQAILDVAHEMFWCPMFFGHKNLRIYAITKQYPESEVYDGWDEVKRLYTMPISLIKKSRYPDMKNYPETMDPVAIPTSKDDVKRFSYQIRVNCFFSGSVWGHLYIYYKLPEVSQRVMQLARHVADIYGEILEKSLNKNAEKYAKYSFLVDVLDGKDRAEEVFQNLYWQLGWDEASRLVLYKLAPILTSNDGILFDWMCDSLSEQAIGSIIFPYRDSIVIVARKTELREPAVLTHIMSMLSLSNYCCGVSFPFVGLKNMQYHYFQAGYAVDQASGTDTKMHHFKDHAFAGFTQFIKTHTSWRSFIMPALYKLIESDSQQGTEYYKTLYYLLINRGQRSSTSTDLYIHRNTLKYRLEKISQILGTNIDDESTASYLRFCYALLMEDFPIAPAARPADNAE